MSTLVRPRDWYLGWMSIYGVEESAENRNRSQEKLKQRSEIAFDLVNTITQKQFRSETFESLAQVLDHEGLHLGVQKRRNPNGYPSRGLEIEATSNIVKELSGCLFSAINPETPYQRELQLRAVLSGLVLQQAQVAKAVQADHHDQLRYQLKNLHRDVQNQRPPSGDFTSAVFREYQSSFLIVAISEYANKTFIRAEPLAATLFRTVINAISAGVYLAVASTAGVGSTSVHDAIRSLDESFQQLGARPDKYAKDLFTLQGLTRRTIALGLHTKVIEGREGTVDSESPQRLALWILEYILMVLDNTETEKGVSSPAYWIKDFCAAAGRNAPSFNGYHFLYGLLDCSTQLARMLLPGMVPESCIEQLDRFQQTMVRIIENSKDRSLRWKAIEFLLLTCPRLENLYPGLNITGEEVVVVKSCFAEERHLDWQQELVDSVIGDLGNGSRKTPRNSVSTAMLLNPEKWEEALPAPSSMRPAQKKGRLWPNRFWNSRKKYYSVGLSPSCRHVFFLGEEDLVIYSLDQVSFSKTLIFKKNDMLRKKLENAQAVLNDTFLAVIVRGVKVTVEGENSGSDSGSSQRDPEKATPSKRHQLWVFRHKGSSRVEGFTFEDIKDFRPTCLALHESSVLIGGYSDGVGVMKIYQIVENDAELRLYRHEERTCNQWTTRYFVEDGPKFVGFDASGQQMVCVTAKENNVLIWPVEGNLKQEPFKLREREKHQGGFSARGVESVSLFRVPSEHAYAFCTNAPTVLHGRERTGGEWPFISPVGTFPAEVPEVLERPFSILGHSTAMVAGAVSAKGNLAAMLAQSGDLIITPLAGDPGGGICPSSSYSYTRLLCERQNSSGSTTSLRFVTQNDQTLLYVADISGKVVKFVF
ncbi:hypothetical protein B0O99DRAFT_592299 [Bisporella sp. PMI_857]|nr:hypothetical protein B0O99DRAFT_592299 [Bisporella sp. PMI_857]